MTWMAARLGAATCAIAALLLPRVKAEARPCPRTPVLETVSGASARVGATSPQDQVREVLVAAWKPGLIHWVLRRAPGANGGRFRSYVNQRTRPTVVELGAGGSSRSGPKRSSRKKAFHCDGYPHARATNRRTAGSRGVAPTLLSLAAHKHCGHGSSRRRTAFGRELEHPSHSHHVRWSALGCAICRSQRNAIYAASGVQSRT
jgi:hypothetical protein